MILLVTNRRDITTDFVVSALRRRGVAFYRLNTEDLLRTTHFAWRPSGWTIRDSRGRTLCAEEIAGAYYRRPRAPHPVDGTAQEAGAFATREAGALLRGLFAHTECEWISDPAAIEGAEDKLLQLRVAESLGLRIPRTVVTNDPDEARAFVASVDAAIVKPLSSGKLCDDPALLAYTSPLRADVDISSVELAPHLLQERIPKIADVRVTVVDERVFACRIDSQAHSATALDWRTATTSGVPLGHALTRLPPMVEAACVSLVRTLGLRFGAIDLVEHADGFTFLEINPNGQWAWVEQRTGAPISDALADALVGSPVLSVAWKT